MFAVSDAAVLRNFLGCWMHFVFTRHLCQPVVTAQQAELVQRVQQALLVLQRHGEVVSVVVVSLSKATEHDALASASELERADEELIRLQGGDLSDQPSCFTKTKKPFEN